MRPQTSSSIDEAPFTAFHWRLAIFANGGLFLDGYVLSNIGVALSLLISHFGLSAAQTGLLGGATLTGLFFGGLVFGYVTDKLGRKLMFTVDLVAILVCSILLFFVDEYWQLLVVRFVLGIAIGADYPIASALMTELTPRKYRGRVIGSTALAWASGAVTAYLVGYLLAGTGPEAWRWILASSAVPAALILLMRVGSPESPRWLVSKGRIDEAQAIVRDVFGPDATLDELPPDEEHKTSLTILFRREYRKRTAFTTLQWLLQAVTLFAIITFAPTILAALGLSEGREAFLGSVFIEVPLVLGGALYALWLLDAWGRRPGAILGFVGATVSSSSWRSCPTRCRGWCSPRSRCTACCSAAPTHCSCSTPTSCSRPRCGPPHRDSAPRSAGSERVSGRSCCPPHCRSSASTSSCGPVWSCPRSVSGCASRGRLRRVAAGWWTRAASPCRPRPPVPSSSPLRKENVVRER